MAKCTICKTSFPLALLDAVDQWIYEHSGMCRKCYEAKVEEWVKDILNTFHIEAKKR